MRRWYAVHCKPREDERAERHLSNQCYEVFRPLIRLRRRRNARMTTVIESLFPRYLFVHLDDAAENWAPIRCTRGVMGLVAFGHGPTEVPEPVIGELRARMDACSGCLDLIAATQLRRNQKVRLIEGPFAGYEALFQARRGEDRVVVLLDVMRQAQRLTVPESALAEA